MHRDSHEHRGRRERRMQENAEAIGDTGLPQGGGKAQQMIVLGPDDVLRPQFCRDSRREEAVDAAIACIVGAGEACEFRPVMQNRPQR